MGKVNCDFCGASFQDSEEKCPICGFSREALANDVIDDILLEDDFNPVEEAGPRRKNKPIFDYDEVNADQDDDSDDEEEDDDDSYDDEDEDEEPRSNTVLIVILILIIALLLLATGFVFFRYFLPNVAGTEEAGTVATQMTSEATEESTVPTVPCKVLAMTSENPKLSREGQPWLIHVTVTPENTTDELLYVSENESVVTVSEDGKIIAVGEGETIVQIICGDQVIKCPVLVDYSLAAEESIEEGVPTMGVEDVEATSDPTDATEETQADATDATEAATEETASTEPVLKLKEVDISLSKVRGITYTLTMDCDIPAEDVEWVTMDSNVLLVKDGVISVMGPGTTKVVAKYNSQTAECIVRCIF